MSTESSQHGRRAARRRRRRDRAGRCPARARRGDGRLEDRHRLARARPTTTAGTSRASQAATQPRQGHRRDGRRSATASATTTPQAVLLPARPERQPVHHRPGRRLQHHRAAASPMQTNVPVIVYDDPRADQADLVGDIETDSQDGGYLAGVLAAPMTKTGTLGIVISADDTNWHKQAGGFVAGARRTNPDIKFAIAQVGQAAYADAAGGKRARRQRHRQRRRHRSSAWATARPSACSRRSRRHAAGRRGQGLVHRRHRRQVRPPIDPKGVVLSSVLWNFSTVFEQAIADIDAGTFGTHGLHARPRTAASRCSRPRTSRPTHGRPSRAAQAVIDGSIKVPVTPDRGRRSSAAR